MKVAIEGLTAEGGGFKPHFRQHRVGGGGASVRDMDELYDAAAEARPVFARLLNEVGAPEDLLDLDPVAHI